MDVSIWVLERWSVGGVEGWRLGALEGAAVNGWRSEGSLLPGFLGIAPLPPAAGALAVSLPLRIAAPPSP